MNKWFYGIIVTSIYSVDSIREYPRYLISATFFVVRATFLLAYSVLLLGQGLNMFMRRVKI